MAGLLIVPMQSEGYAHLKYIEFEFVFTYNIILPQVSHVIFKFSHVKTFTTIMYDYDVVRSIVKNLNQPFSIRKTWIVLFCHRGILKHSMCLLCIHSNKLSEITVLYQLYFVYYYFWKNCKKLPIPKMKSQSHNELHIKPFQQCFVIIENTTYATLYVYFSSNFPIIEWRFIPYCRFVSRRYNS